GKNLLNEVLVLHVAYYLAPEQIEGKSLDARTDLYALGVLLYEMVTGQLPFAGLDQVVMRAHLYDNPVPPRRLNPEISRPLDHFILKLLSKSPDDRYATAHQAQRVLSNLSHYGERQAIRAPALSHPQQHPMIGRQEPLREILECWEAACKGQGQLVLIAGETGIGKTRLTEEVANLIPTGTMLVGHCHAVEGSLAYQPFIEALRTYFGSVPPNTTDEHVGRLLSNVVRWVPEIRAILPSLPEAPPLEPKQEQLRLMNSLARYIERATEEQPWLLILDDLHWVDQSSLQLLHYLARHCGSMALLIIGTYRDTDLLDDHPLLDTLHDLQRSPGYRQYVLDRLTEAEVGQMLAAMWAQQIPDSLTRKIYEVTEGNPFYVEEVVKGMMDDGTAARLDGAWVFSSTVEIRLPKSVRDAVLRRITYLRQDTQKLLRQAAVLGRTFNFDDLQQMSGLSEWELLERLDEALERQLVEEAPAETMLRFRHAEIQHVLYHELGNIRRRLLHRQAGDALEVRHLSDPRHMVEELAHHFEEAGEAEKALIYSIQAARHADGAYASQTALQWYNRALAMLDRLELDASTHNQRYELLLALERLYGRQGMRDKQLANLRQALTVANNLNDLAKQAHVHNQLCFYYRMVSDYAAARTHAELGLEAARQAKAPVLEGESLSNLAYVEQDQGQYQSALEHMEDAQAILEATNDRRLEAISLKGLGLLHLKLNNYEKARLYFEQALALNRSLGNRRGESDCLNNLGEIERERGNYAAASACYEQTLGIDRAIGNRYGEAIALLNLALTYLALGSYQKAHEFVEEAVQINQSIDDQLGRAEALNIQSDIHYALEAYESARDDAKEALATFQKLATPMTIATAQLSLGLALEALQDHAPAVEAFEQAATQWRELGDEANALDAQAGLARCALAAGEVERALEIVEQSLTWLQTHSLTGLDHPFRFYQTAYTVLQQAGQTERAITVLTEAHDLLQTRATTIADETLRQSYLENVPQNRAIVQAWREISTSS
ncbi:MAG: tetratricopeptide repeat protein, partial [Anaerolineae bacterium]|nr:tetratricopeptide repeat protein [Anaerolineae bacterium]